MAIIEYKTGEHPGGFVGFRVVRTLGSQSLYRQKYFSVNQLTYKEAERLAEQQDKDWSKRAEALKSAQVVRHRRKNAGRHIIAQGLRASILIDKRVRAGELRTYYSPAFLVKKPGRNQSDVSFRIKKLGYRKAYIEAVNQYAEIHQLESGQRLALASRLPDRSLFTDYLQPKLKQCGHKLTKAVLESMLE